MPGSIQMRGSMNMRGAIVPTIYMGSSTPQSQGGLSYMTRYDSQNAEEKGKEKHHTSPTSVLEGPGVSPNSSRSTWSLESSGEPVTLRSQTASRRVDFSAADPTLSDDEDVIEKGNQPVKKQKIDKGGHFEVSSFPARRLVRGKRIYDSLLGRTCHWCRQKTVEYHVICSTCPIQFCGPCLLNRHGEHILEEMREGVNWVCPRCRGGCGPGCSNCCNCGPCRRAQGLPPTGQLVKEARGAGFTNVHDFLVSQFTGECQEQIALRKVGRNWTVDPNNADLKYREPKKLSSDWNPSQFQGSQTEEACGQIGISTPRMRGAISRPFMTMKDKFHTPSGCSGPTTAACSQLPNYRNQKSSDNFEHSSAGLISDDDKKSVIALPTSSDKMNLMVEIKHCGEFTDCNRPLVDLPDLRNPHSHSSDGSLATSLPTYHKERVSRFEEKTATESVYRPDKEALDRKVAFVGVKQEASCFVHKAFGEVTEVREEIANGSSRIRIPTLEFSDLTSSSFAPSATPLVKGQAVESKSAVEEQKVAIKRLDDSATPNAEGMCSGNDNQCSCRHLSRSREASQLSEEVIDLSESINAYSNDLQPRPSCCRIVRSLGTAKTETHTSPEIATSMSTVDHSNIVTLSEPSISSSIEDKSGRAQNLTVLIKTTAENITKKEKTTEKISVPGMKEATAFNERLRAVFDEPFNMHELAQLWEQISHRKPVTRQRETRRGSFEVTTNEEGLSYLDHHPDLGLKLSTTVDPEVKLQMLRGFFCWLQCACLPGAFKPWVDSKDASSQDEDCLVTDGPDCEIIAVVFSLDDDQALSMQRTNSCATRSKENYDRKHDDMEPDPNVSGVEVIVDKIEDIKLKLDQNVHSNAQVTSENIDVLMDDQGVSVPKTNSSQSGRSSNFDGKNEHVELKPKDDMTSTARVIVDKVELKPKVNQHAYCDAKVISGNVEALGEELEDVKLKLGQEVNSNPQEIALANVPVVCLDDDEIKPILDQDAIASAEFLSKSMKDAKPHIINQDSARIDDRVVSVSTTSSSHSGRKRNIYGNTKDSVLKSDEDTASQPRIVVDEVGEVKPERNQDAHSIAEVLVEEIENVKPKLNQEVRSMIVEEAKYIRPASVPVICLDDDEIRPILDQHGYSNTEVIVEDIEHVKPKLNQELNSIAHIIVDEVKDIRPADVPVICLDEDEIKPILDQHAVSNLEFLSISITDLIPKSNQDTCPKVQISGGNLLDGKPKLLKPKRSCYLTLNSQIILIDDEEITPKVSQEKARLQWITNGMPSQVILDEDEDNSNAGHVTDVLFISKAEPICHSNFEELCC